MNSIPQIFVNIGQYKVIKNNESAILVAQNLGSCLGLAAFDRIKKIYGMIHCLLPLSSRDPQKAKQNPALYVDTGVPLLLETLVELGCSLQDLEIYVAGCGHTGKELDPFEIGQKNYTIFRKLAWKNALCSKGEHVGGNIPRTLILNTVEETVIVKTPDKMIYL